jgi:sugar/nucleoside kinase (ribokinase family)
MNELAPLQPIDYLLIGHITVDLTPQGRRLGGTVAYAALTAQALGLRVGLVTSWGGELSLGLLNSIPIINFPAEQSTTFENTYVGNERVQTLLHTAPSLDYYQIPEVWRSAPIVHLGPVAQEVEPALVRNFPTALIGVTPQGWLRGWRKDGRIFTAEWPEASFVLERCGAAIISEEDVKRDESRIEEMAAASRVLVVTDGDQGCRLFWNGDVRRFRAPEVTIVDPTGAGDVFAAAFFVRLFITRDPWEAARFATQIAAISVTRPGMEGTPTPEEIKDNLVEVY